jgi:arylsulfatase A-like enzyme
MANQHPVFKNILEKYTNEDNFSEIRFSDLNEKDIRKIKSVYFGMCAEVDDNIGKIVQVLKETKHYENTMIVFTSDHGEMLGENKQWGKSGWWDASYRIPLIIHIPGEKKQIINDFTESVDIAPTILDWLNISIPTDWNGQSLLASIKNSTNKLPSKEYVIFDWDFRENHYTSFVQNKELAPEECNLSVIRTKEWKYVHFPSLPPLLFNMLEDPYEINNLANKKDYLKTQNKLLSKLLSHRMIHQERQLSNSMLTEKGMKINSGPSNRQVKK